MAHAKLCGHVEAQLEDACIAVLLMERSLVVRPLLTAFDEEVCLFDEAPEPEFYERFRAELLKKLEIREEALQSSADEFELEADSLPMPSTQFTCATSK